MRGNASLVSILIMSIILVQLSGILASAEGKDANQGAAESLAVMATQDPSKDVPSVDEYINRTNAEPFAVVLSPSNPGESRAKWLQGNNEDTNDSKYLDLMELVRTQYTEDLNYSSYILDEFVKKKIDARAAMTATMTLFILTSETVDMMDQIKPPAKFEEYQNTTQFALINLEGYLWNMVKFYETNKRVYAVQAHDNFNNSMSYYEKGANFSISRGDAKIATLD
jgi:hypothetical protein